MKNYWLSDFDHISEAKKSGPDMEDTMDPEDMMDNSDDEDSEDDPKKKLNDRQHALHKLYEMVVEEYGMFDQSAKANGAHYARAKDNPFINEGLKCGNCIFYMGGGACELVKGTIESDAVCKLWIIPEELIKKK